MSDETRYAIYFLPAPESALANAGATWLGFDVFKGATLAHPNAYAIKPDEIAAVTTHPRHYGFHGTLKAPFRLKAGLSEEDVCDAFHQFTRLQRADACPVFEVSELDGFYALTPRPASNSLAHIAEHAVRHFEPLRSPLTQSDYERRKPHLLSDRQRAYLVEWGYPYVLEEFRFHMTLSDKITDTDVDHKIKGALNSHFSENLLIQSTDFCVALCVEENKQPFKVLASSPLNVPFQEEVSHVS